MFHTEDPQTSGTTMKRLVAMVTWCPGFVHPWSKGKLFSVSFYFPYSTAAKFCCVL